MKLSFYDENMQQTLKAFQLTDEQLRFVKSPQLNVEEAKNMPSRKPVFGFDEGNAVVFFVLDTDSEYKEKFNVSHSIYIRSFAVAPRYVRQGFATAALEALPDFVRAHYPDVEYITLIVDEPNPGAKELYLKQGFELGDAVQGPRYPGYTMKKCIRSSDLTYTI
ncbi:GNAT family N-acetyltransferase [Macrococcus brunensis]|uniref:GNAT family N-acetyltransferase n=1 Tax=Macrococcus brunensis TaxID=198483 RepID=UPI001EF0ABC2|nr:GNAT family N-acetyltransferase [Macrococcus brunensis]ULG72252.1 GNAT family N-acetyltransferase [Macrococcus brunensis]